MFPTDFKNMVSVSGYRLNKNDNFIASGYHLISYADS